MGTSLGDTPIQSCDRPQAWTTTEDQAGRLWELCGSIHTRSKGSMPDIRTAFLNAPLDVEDDGQDPTIVVLKPPSLLIKTGHVGVKVFGAEGHVRSATVASVLGTTS